MMALRAVVAVVVRARAAGPADPAAVAGGLDAASAFAGTGDGSHPAAFSQAQPESAKFPVQSNFQAVAFATTSFARIHPPRTYRSERHSAFLNLRQFTLDDRATAGAAGSEGGPGGCPESAAWPGENQELQNIIAQISVQDPNRAAAIALHLPTGHLRNSAITPAGERLGAGGQGGGRGLSARAARRCRHARGVAESCRQPCGKRSESGGRFCPHAPDARPPRQSARPSGLLVGPVGLERCGRGGVAVAGK